MASENSRRRWSAKVTETSDALDLEEGIFNARSARRIAASLDFCEVYPQWRNDGLRARSQRRGGGVCRPILYVSMAQLRSMSYLFPPS